MRSGSRILILFTFSVFVFVSLGDITPVSKKAQGQTKAPSMIAPSIVGRVPYKANDGKEAYLFDGSYALVIGVSRYTNGYPSLTLVDQDTNQVKAILERHGFLVKTVPNPTQMELEKAVSEFISEVGHNPGNRLLIYFAGHGETLSTGAGIKMGYIVPSNAPLLSKNKPAFMATAIPMDRIIEYAKTIESRHALFVFDSCFAGTLFEVRGAASPVEAWRSAPPAIISKAAEPVRQFITAGSSTETVPTQSLFVSNLVNGLTGDADMNHDGYITGNELGDYLRYNVEGQSGGRYSPRHAAISDSRLNQGDFIFAVPGSEVSPTTPSQQASPAPQVSPTTPQQSSPAPAQKVPTPTKKRLEAKDLYDQAWQLMNNKKPEQAESKFQGAVFLFPENAKYHIDYGWCLYGLKKIEEAEGEFRQAISLNPSKQDLLGEAHFGLCITLEKQDDTDGAQSECQKALQLGGPTEEIKKTLTRLKKH